MRRYAFLLAAALLAPLPAAAQVTNYPNLLPQNWSAEPKGMEDETLGLLLPCGINRISANMRLSNRTKLRALLPSVEMNFSTGRSSESVLLRLQENDARLELIMRKGGGARNGQELRFTMPGSYGRDMAVVVRWHADGRFDVTAGGRTHSLPMKAAPTDVELIARGGKGDITNLRTGWEGAGQSAACAKPLR